MIYIGNFLCMTNQEKTDEADRRHGEFNMIVEAANGNDAIQQFKERIVELREASQFFEGRCTIYFIQLLEFETFPRDQALILNYKSTAGDPIMPFIGCSIPNDQSDSCQIYNWEDNAPEIDGKNERSFLYFDA